MDGIEYHEFQNTNKKDVGVLILKYGINNIAQEVVLGVMEKTYNMSKKIKKIRSLVVKQLKENVKQTKDYTALTELKRYLINDKEVPFKITPEGTIILKYCKPGDIDIPRTYFEQEDERGNSKSKLEEITGQEREDALEIINKMNDELNQLSKRLRDQEKWQDRREKILNILTEEKKEKFLKGEVFVGFLQEYKEENKQEQREDETTGEISEQEKQVIEDYMKNNYLEHKIEAFHQNGKITPNERNTLLLKLRQEMEKIKIVMQNQENSSDETIEKLKEKYKENDEKYSKIAKNPQLAENEKIIIDEYIELKEKKLAISAKKILEDKLEQNYEEGTDDRKIEVYNRFFELIKQRKASVLWYARENKIDFDDVMKTFLELAPEDDELIEYIFLKLETMKNPDIKFDNNIDDYEKYASVRDLDDFLITSSIREDSNRNIENKLLQVRDIFFKDMIKKNKEEIGVFGEYAKNSEYFKDSNLEMDKLLEKDSKELEK